MTLQPPNTLPLGHKLRWSFRPKQDFVWGTVLYLQSKAEPWNRNDEGNNNRIAWRFTAPHNYSLIDVYSISTELIDNSEFTSEVSDNFSVKVISYWRRLFTCNVAANSGTSDSWFSVPPASRRRTVFEQSSLRRFAITAPAEPPPVNDQFTSMNGINKAEGYFPIDIHNTFSSMRMTGHKCSLNKYKTDISNKIKYCNHIVDQRLDFEWKSPHLF